MLCVPLCHSLYSMYRYVTHSWIPLPIFHVQICHTLLNTTHCIPCTDMSHIPEYYSLYSLYRYVTYYLRPLPIFNVQTCHTFLNTTSYMQWIYMSLYIVLYTSISWIYMSHVPLNHSINCYFMNIYVTSPCKSLYMLIFHDYMFCLSLQITLFTSIPWIYVTYLCKSLNKLVFHEYISHVYVNHSFTHIPWIYVTSPYKSLYMLVFHEYMCHTACSLLQSTKTESFLLNRWNTWLLIDCGHFYLTWNCVIVSANWSWMNVLCMNQWEEREVSGDARYWAGLNLPCASWLIEFTLGRYMCDLFLCCLMQLNSSYTLGCSHLATYSLCSSMTLSLPLN